MKRAAFGYPSPIRRWMKLIEPASGHDQLDGTP
jgi:hypothetical protein